MLLLLNGISIVKYSMLATKKVKPCMYSIQRTDMDTAFHQILKWHGIFNVEAPVMEYLITLLLVSNILYNSYVSSIYI